MRYSVVYFAQAGTDGPIKIGTSKDAVRRMRGLRLKGHGPVRLLATIPGDESVERVMHQRFAAFAIGGEWHRPAPEILAFIARPERVEGVLCKNATKAMISRARAERRRRQRLAFARAVRQWIADRGLTVGEFASAAGIPLGAASRCNRGFAPGHGAACLRVAAFTGIRAPVSGAA